MAVYFVGFLAFCAVLVARSPWFGFFCWIGYMHAFRYLTGPCRYAGLAAAPRRCPPSRSWAGSAHRPRGDVAIFALVGLLNATLVTAFIYLGAEGRRPEPGTQADDRASWPRPTAGWRR